MSYFILINYSNFQNGGNVVLDANSHKNMRFNLSNTNKLLNLIKLPIYSLLCDTSQIHRCTTMLGATWLEELSDNYTAAVFVYYNTGKKLWMLT